MDDGTDGLSLRLERRLTTPPTRVFGAWIDADSLAQWWGPAGFTIPSVELEPRVGGLYRIAMLPPQGERFYLRGEFREVDPPRRLAYTFEWEEPTPDDRVTLVTLTFEPLGEGSCVTVDHGVFSTEERRRLHEAGWADTLDRLEAWLATGTGTQPAT